jgi:hypothetical protein
VTPIGHTEFRQVKAFGYCVFLATKLSKGTNEIVCDPWLKQAWPTKKGGRLSFKKQKYGEYDGYLINNSADR